MRRLMTAGKRRKVVARVFPARVRREREVRKIITAREAGGDIERHARFRGRKIGREHCAERVVFSR